MKHLSARVLAGLPRRLADRGNFNPRVTIVVRDYNTGLVFPISRFGIEGFYFVIQGPND